MHFFIFVILICFLIFLFCLYLLVNDDFVLLRKDISTEKVFNMAFAASLFALIGSRVLFVALNPSSRFLNPLVFLAFPYFPGLSLVGGLLGGMIGLILLTKRDSKIPAARLFDFFSISFLSPMSLGFLGYFLLSKSKFFSYQSVSSIIIYLALFIVFIKYLLPNLLSSRFKEGTVGLIFLISFSAISLLENFIGEVGGKIYFTFEDFILLVMLVASLAFLIKHEKLVEKVRKIK